MKAARSVDESKTGAVAMPTDAGAGNDIETELKLDVPPRLAAKVLAHRVFRSRGSGRWVRSRLLGVYYDTPQFDLWHARISVRLRRSPSGWVQTIKWAGGALGGLHQRNELEWAMPDQTLSFQRIEQRAGLDVLCDERLQRKLKPVFVTDFERSARMITLRDGSRVEASLDRGRIVCGTTAHPICELELELKGGLPWGLFDVSAALMADLSVRPAHRSKAERGYLLAGLASVPSKGRRVELPALADVPGAVAMFVASGLEQIQANEHGMLGGDDIEYLHQMRVGLRRLRSCLSAFGSAMPKAEIDALRDELRWLAGRLGSARDWDVFLEESLPVLLDGLEGVASTEDLTALAQAAHVLKGRAAIGARTALKSRRTSALLLALGRMAAGGGMLADPAVVKVPLADYGPGLLDRRLESVLRRGKKARKRGTVAQLHELRIAVKKLRYAAEFVGEALADKERVRAYHEMLAKLQTGLGHICDAAAMTHRVDEAVPDRVALVASVRGWSACAVHTQRRRLHALWREFRKTERFW